MIFHLIAPEHYTLVVSIVGTTLLGITAGCIGVFAVLRKQSLLGDMISHAALPGIAFSLLITHSRYTPPLIMGGVLSSILATACTLYVTKRSCLKIDSVLGITLSVFFGIGLIFMTALARYGLNLHSVAHTFLLGNPATLLPIDLLLMLVTTVLVILSVCLFWKEFRLLSFDEPYASTVGYTTLYLDIFLTALLITTIVIGLQSVGVILMSALIIAPASAARQWTNSLSAMIVLAAVIGAASGIVGSMISNEYSHMPAGPTIVLVLSTIVLISFCCTHNRHRT